MNLVDINSLADKTLDEGREELRRAGYEVYECFDEDPRAVQEIWTLKEDRDEMIMAGGPLERGQILHNIFRAGGCWHDFDGGTLRTIDGPAPRYYVAYYSLIAANIDLPYEIIAAWDDTAYILAMDESAYIILVDDEEPMGHHLFEKPRTVESVQNAIDLLLDCFGEPDWFYTEDGGLEPDLWKYVNVLKVWPGGEYMFLLYDDIYIVDKSGNKKHWGKDTNETILKAMEFIHDTYYQPVEYAA